MDALGNIPQVVIKPATPALPKSAPAPQKADVPFVPVVGGGSTAEVSDAQQQRYEAVRRASQQVADLYVVSDKTFTIFKDVSGQYVTRFTSLRDGKVTYIPEPNLFRLGGESDKPLFNINA